MGVSCRGSVLKIKISKWLSRAKTIWRLLLCSVLKMVLWIWQSCLLWTDLALQLCRCLKAQTTVGAQAVVGSYPVVLGLISKWTAHCLQYSLFTQCIYTVYLHSHCVQCIYTVTSMGSGHCFFAAVPVVKKNLLTHPLDTDVWLDGKTSRHDLVLLHVIFKHLYQGQVAKDC